MYITEQVREKLIQGLGRANARITIEPDPSDYTDDENAPERIETTATEIADNLLGWLELVVPGVKWK